MANITLKISRSDVYPIGTSVGAYTKGAKMDARKPAGSAIATATVDAAGLLSISVPEKTAIHLWAEVSGEHRYIDANGDNYIAGVPSQGVLAARVQRRRVLAGA
jgi:hypothetical protein